MTTRRLVIAIGVAAAGCGDDRHVAEDPLAAASGTRIALQKYRYDDGTEQAVAGEFYDRITHTRCRPLAWADGVPRCVPVADDAAYLDAACTQLVGLGQTIARPTHFITYDTQPAGRIVTRVVRAGPPRDAIAQYYQVVGGACTGPVAVPAQLTRFFAPGAELDASDLVALHDREVGDGRLAISVRQTDDGLRVPAGLRDRELGAACAPTVRGDGAATCEPVGATTPSYFRDPACSQPAVAVGAATTAAIARLVEPSGCASYHHLGEELAAPIYRRDGAACTAADAPAGTRMFAIGGAIDLPPLDRSFEGGPGQRLQHVVFQTGDPAAPRYIGDAPFDTAMATTCAPRQLRDAIRCVPASVTATTLLLAGCTQQVRVAEVPQQACAPIGFATTNRPFQIAAIGGVVTDPLFRQDGGACTPYSGAPGDELRAVGPAIDITSLVSAIYYGDR